MGAGECGDDVGTRPRGASAAMRARRRFFSQPADETPLDWRTICVVQAFSMCSIAATTALFSTAFFMAKRFDAQASERELAWRAGALTAMKPAFAGLTSMIWGHAGDRFGFERAIAMSGLLHAGATAAFAFARGNGQALALRALQGAADGLVVMQKPALALVSDATNAARAFSTTGVAYGVASAFSPALAAALSEPCENWDMFKGSESKCPKFLERYPFFLSNIWVSALAVPALAAYAKGWMQIDCHRDEDKREVVVELELLATNDSETDNGASSKDGKIETKSVDGAADEIAWWRDANVRAAIATQVGCTFVTLCGAEMTPLWMATSYENGGLGWTSLEIGAFGTVMGTVILMFQVFLFTRLVRKHGIVSLLTYALMVNVVAFPLHPIAHVVAKRSKALVWVVIVCLGLARGMSGPIIMGGSSLILNNSSPRDTLGAVNGFSGTFGNAARALAPLIGGALVAMMVAMSPNTPARELWPFAFVSFGFLSLTILSRRLSTELNIPRTRSSTNLSDGGVP